MQPDYEDSPTELPGSECVTCTQSSRLESSVEGISSRIIKRLSEAMEDL